MSEFECRYGHLMLPSQGPFCKVCQEYGRKERVYRMDGKTATQLLQEENEDRSIPRPPEKD